MQDLLDQTASRTLEKQTLDQQFHQLYHWLVLATAWKKSCWGQFVRVGDRIKAMLSPVGAVGIMQVNQPVWRGFYDLKDLNQDIGSNAAQHTDSAAQRSMDSADTTAYSTVTSILTQESTNVA